MNSDIIEKAEKILGKKLRCLAPFTRLEFHPDGDVSTCCLPLINGYKLGNIFKSSLDEIWNGKKAVEFRNSIIDGSFKYCNIDSCILPSILKINPYFDCNDDVWNNIINKPVLKHVYFHIDLACTCNCIMCRDQKIHDNELAKKYKEKIDSIIPLLSDVEYVYLNGAGEIFASDLCKTLVKEITSTYPKIKFDIITNGILASEHHFTELGLIDKLNTIEVSMHAATKETYNMIVRNGNYDKLIKNLKFISSLKQNHKLNQLILNFVVMKFNYFEMPEFKKLADSFGATAQFWEYRKRGDTELDNHYDEVAVFEPSHPEYHKFLEVLNHEALQGNDFNINLKLKPKQ